MAKILKEIEALRSEILCLIEAKRTNEELMSVGLPMVLSKLTIEYLRSPHIINLIENKEDKEIITTYENLSPAEKKSLIFDPITNLKDIHIAVLLNRKTLVEFLLSYYKTKKGRYDYIKNDISVVALAATSKDKKTRLELVSAFLRNQFNPNKTVTLNGDTLLHLAAYISDKELFSLILGFKADIDCQNIQGQTPLHIAVEQNAVDMVSYILVQHAKVNIRDKTAKTPIHIAEAKNYNEISELLRKWILEMTNQLGMAINSKNLNKMEELIRLGIDHTGRDKDGATLFHYACAVGNTQMVELLYDACPKFLTIRDDFGHLPIFYTISNPDQEVLRFLISKSLLDEEINNDPYVLCFTRPSHYFRGDNKEQKPTSVMPKR
jgi:ankyrin repeat protein